MFMKNHDCFSAGYGLLAYLDFTFALLIITVWSKFAQIRIGYKFASLMSACTVKRLLGQDVRWY